MKHLFLPICVLTLFFCWVDLKAQESANTDAVKYSGDAVKLVVSGSGNTQDAAIQNALRSAIEQTFGVFISSDTRILNDKQTKDEIISMSAGNVEGYEVAESYQNSNTYYVTLNAVVSPSNLAKFATSHGAATELVSETSFEVSGASFMKDINLSRMNTKIHKLQAINYKKALEKLQSDINEMCGKVYYKISIENIGKPILIRNGLVEIEVNVLSEIDQTVDDIINYNDKILKIINDSYIGAHGDESMSDFMKIFYCFKKRAARGMFDKWYPLASVPDLNMFLEEFHDSYSDLGEIIYHWPFSLRFQVGPALAFKLVDNNGKVLFKPEVLTGQSFDKFKSMYENGYSIGAFHILFAGNDCVIVRNDDPFKSFIREPDDWSTCWNLQSIYCDSIQNYKSQNRVNEYTLELGDESAKVKLWTFDYSNIIAVKTSINLLFSEEELAKVSEIHMESYPELIEQLHKIKGEVPLFEVNSSRLSKFYFPF